MCPLGRPVGKQICGCESLLYGGVRECTNVDTAHVLHACGGRVVADVLQFHMHVG